MVFARIFDNTGNPLTNDFRVDQVPDIGSDPSIAVDSNDHFIIAWEETRLDQIPENDDIFVRIFDSTGNPLTNEYRVDQDIGTNEAGEPVIATDSNNNFIIAWTDYRSGHGDIFATTVNNPAPDIKVNGSDGLLTIPQGDLLTVTVALDPGSYDGVNADWWVAAYAAPFGWYYYNAYTGSWISGFSCTYQGPLFDLSPYEVLNTSGLPISTYTFYFGVDRHMNCSWDDSQYYDSVIVNIE